MMLANFSHETLTLPKSRFGVAEAVSEELVDRINKPRQVSNHLLGPGESGKMKHCITNLGGKLDNLPQRKDMSQCYKNMRMFSTRRPMILSLPTSLNIRFR